MDSHMVHLFTLLALRLAILLGGFPILADYISTRSRKSVKYTEGEPIVIIKDGKILEKNLKQIPLDTDNLRMLLTGLRLSRSFLASVGRREGRWIGQHQMYLNAGNLDSFCENSGNIMKVPYKPNEYNVHSRNRTVDKNNGFRR